MIKIINQYIAWLEVMLGIVGLPMEAGAQGTCNIVRNPEIIGAIPNQAATSFNIWYGMGWFDTADGFNSGLTWAANSPNFALPGANSASTFTPPFAFSSFNNVGGCLNMAAYFGNCPEGTTPTTPEGTIIRVVDTSSATAMRIPIFGCTIEESVLLDINGFTNTNATNRYFFAVREQHYANSSTAQNIGLRATLFNPNALLT